MKKTFFPSSQPKKNSTFQKALESLTKLSLTLTVLTALSFATTQDSIDVPTVCEDLQDENTKQLCIDSILEFKDRIEVGATDDGN